MKRSEFLRYLALLPLISNSMKLSALSKLADSFDNSEKMPALFLGHGSPMNAIEENEFVKSFRTLGAKLPKPKAIICISAHWETKGTFVTAMENPKTIHDFGGFPQALYDVQYPAPGSRQLAQQTKDLINKTDVGLDDKWGLDHGAWSVVKHLYPNANIPVVQLSLDYQKDAQYHYDLAKQITSLRQKGILIIGSGNIVHNLRMVAWDKLKGEPYAFDWASEANQKMKDFIVNDNHKSLINYQNQGSAFKLAIPTPEHYLPLLYILALKDKKEEVSIFNDKPIGGSLSMTSIKVS